MPITNQPQPSTYQVGDTVYLLENSIPISAIITNTLTTVTDIDSNGTAEVSTLYQLEDRGSQLFPESKLYDTKSHFKTAINALIDALA